MPSSPPCLAWRALRHLAALLLVLPLCAPAPAQVNPPVGAPATDPTLAGFEAEARARPLVIAARLGDWAAGLPEGDGRRMQAQALRGALLAARDDSEGAERALRQIEQQRTSDPAAASAAGLVQAALVRRHGPLGQAERIVGEALARLPADGPLWLRQRLLRLQGDVMEQLGKFDDAVRLRDECIALADRAGPAWRRSEERDKLGYTLMLAGQSALARQAADEALAIAEQLNDRVARSRALTTRAFLLGEQGDAAGELAAMTRSIDDAHQAGAREIEVLALANLADHYLKRGDYATTLRLSREALPLARALADETAESVALANIGLALISQHRRAEGLATMRQAIAVDERAGALTNLAVTHGEMGEYLERAGYAADALAAYRAQRRITDEVVRRDQQRAILEQQERYDSERRRREIELLQRENLLKQTELANLQLEQRILLAGALAGLALLALAAVVLHRLTRRRRALHKRHAQLRDRSESDPLTGLANRRHLQRVMQADAAAAPFAGSLLLLDLDHFKGVNDRFGHASGDAALIEVARRLRAALREDDLLVRWGGEEFLVIARALTPEQTQALAERLLASVGASPVPLAGSTVALTLSIGYACFPLAPTRLALAWERALALVDTALYLAKAHGRNRAYGVQSLHARDSAELAEIGRGLEAAWAAGRVDLMPLSGPSAAPSNAAPARVAEGLV